MGGTSANKGGLPHYKKGNFQGRPSVFMIREDLVVFYFVVVIRLVISSYVILGLNLCLKTFPVSTCMISLEGEKFLLNSS